MLICDTRKVVTKWKHQGDIEKQSWRVRTLWIKVYCMKRKRRGIFLYLLCSRLLDRRVEYMYRGREPNENVRPNGIIHRWIQPYASRLFEKRTKGWTALRFYFFIYFVKKKRETTIVIEKFNTKCPHLKF